MKQLQAVASEKTALIVPLKKLDEVIVMRSNASAATKKPGEIYAIGLIKDMVRHMEGTAVTAGLKALRQSKYGEDTEVYCGRLLKPWMDVLASNAAYLRIDLTAALNQRLDLSRHHEHAAKQSKETREQRAPIFRRMICNSLDDFRGKKQDSKIIKMNRASR